MKEYKCKYCDKVFKSQGALGTHLKFCNTPIPVYEYKCICKRCGNEYIVNKTESQYKRGDYPKYCCKKCANSRTQTEETKEKIRKSINENVKFTKKGKKCKICGTINCTHEFCKNKYKFTQLKTLVKYFTFNEQCIGTLEVFNEYERVKQMLYDDYVTNELTTGEIGKKYNYKSYGNFILILDNLGIKNGYDGEKLEFPFYLTSYGIKSDDDEYNYKLNIKWNYCPICGVKID